jgi:hypothetical protein
VRLISTSDMACPVPDRSVGYSASAKAPRNRASYSFDGFVGEALLVNCSSASRLCRR